MLRGHIFKFQTFSNDVFAHFINTFLRGNMGVTKGCELNKTTNSVTIGAGYFCVCGRFLEIIGSETIEDITNTGYYSLVCEIDLSKTNTKSELNQATIKVIRNTSGYGILTKEDLFEGGNIYQYEFARFKVTEAGMVDFEDRRTFLNLESLYSLINNTFNELFEQKNQEAENLLEEIRQELSSIVDGSAYLLKSGGTIDGNLQINGKIKTDSLEDSSGNIYINSSNIKHVEGNVILSNGSGNVTVNYPSGFNKNNCIVIATSITGIYSADSYYSCAGGHVLETRLLDNNISLICATESGVGSNKSVIVTAYLMKVR